MPVEVGQVLKGTVTGVKKFGAFIKLPDGSTGLCHISEVSNDFVKDLETHLTMEQEVSVKVIGIGKDGKINLSIKQTQPKTHRPYKERPQFKQETVKDFDSLVSDFLKTSDEKLKTVKSGKTRRGNGYNKRK
ncbi:MAG: S1 RNA-binding domain-containing protein [Clostridiales bacterium]|nr:S1 RNA-binding domain-containing protein [Clostridiales bacterium]